MGRAMGLKIQVWEEQWRWSSGDQWNQTREKSERLGQVQLPPLLPHNAHNLQIRRSISNCATATCVRQRTATKGLSIFEKHAIICRLESRHRSLEDAAGMWNLWRSGVSLEGWRLPPLSTLGWKPKRTQWAPSLQCCRRYAADSHLRIRYKTKPGQSWVIKKIPLPPSAVVRLWWGCSSVSPPPLRCDCSNRTCELIFSQAVESYSSLMLLGSPFPTRNVVACRQSQLLCAGTRSFMTCQCDAGPLPDAPVHEF